MKERRILLCRRRCGGGSADSNSRAAVEVVRKHPKIAFIAILCAVSRFGKLGGAMVETGTCTHPWHTARFLSHLSITFFHFALQLTALLSG